MKLYCKSAIGSRFTSPNIPECAQQYASRNRSTQSEGLIQKVNFVLLLAPAIQKFQRDDCKSHETKLAQDVKFVSVHT